MAISPQKPRAAPCRRSRNPPSIPARRAAGTWSVRARASLCGTASRPCACCHRAITSFKITSILCPVIHPLQAPARNLRRRQRRGFPPKIATEDRGPGAARAQLGDWRPLHPRILLRWVAPLCCAVHAPHPPPRPKYSPLTATTRSHEVSLFTRLTLKKLWFHELACSMLQMAARQLAAVLCASSGQSATHQARPHPLVVQ